jgi:glutathione S-transferase
MKLYTYYRSQASFRVRIALNLKGSDDLGGTTAIPPDKDLHRRQTARCPNAGLKKTGRA